MTRVLAFIFALACGVGAFFFVWRESFVNPYPIVCNLVLERIYLTDKELSEWKNQCFRRSGLVKPNSPRSLILKDMNNLFALLKVSHLEIYDPEEVRAIWQGETKETGIESAFVDGELVVFRIHSQSPAAQKGLRFGDIIQSINSESPNPWEAQTTSGDYILKRESKSWSEQLKTDAFKRDEEVDLTWFPKGRLVMRIPSFRAPFFEEAKIDRMAQEMSKARKVVLDMRGNLGGSFAAGLRFLSLFMCEPTEVGRLIRPRMPGADTGEFLDDLRDEEQLKVLHAHREVVLKTFRRETCFKGPISVLVDGKSASMAELVAQALKELRSASLLGEASAGQLLVGVWYDVGELGQGVQVSIPEAVYVSVKQHRIEGRGVELDRVLHYDLPEMQKGLDSWVQRALD